MILNYAFFYLTSSSTHRTIW